MKMAPELSSNWKKLEQSLKRESKASKDLKRKTIPTERQKNSIAKRKRLEAKAGVTTSTDFGRKRQKMGAGGSTEVEGKSSTQEPSTSLALWAEDNDISAKDLAAAYGSDVQIRAITDAKPDQVNEGLALDVEIGQFIAMDCEMVGVGGDEDRSVLARVSIVNFHGTQVYDSFVRPKEFVTDWRTHVSGVSPKNMATARTFEEVQEAVSRLMEGRILVGHAIKHDLDVLMLSHSKRDIRDTSRFSGFRKYSAGRTPSLKKLAKEVLGINIQGGEHSSIEDARTTMLLFRKFKSAFDVEHANRFPQRTVNEDGSSKSKSKKKGKNKR
jgi:RNA exonuclease 4